MARDVDALGVHLQSALPCRDAGESAFSVFLEATWTALRPRPPIHDVLTDINARAAAKAEVGHSGLGVRCSRRGRCHGGPMLDDALLTLSLPQRPQAAGAARSARSAQRRPASD